MNNDNNSLAQGLPPRVYKMELQIPYSICTEISKKIIYGEIRNDIGKILRQLCEWKEVKIIEAELCKKHVHMLVEIPPKISVSGFVGFSI